ncbi:MAG: tetratricopeptide repeat protein [Candidatus Sumerlaeia bacterium]|nr:tetratricopeptide repeat protein [Candidatus Sumerlaeia bacterium]
MSKQDLYERELTRYRDTLRLDTEVALNRYGMTLIHSLGPAEKVLAMKEMGQEISNPVDYYNLGHMHAVDENWDEAINFFKRAIELDPTLHDALYNLAVCYQKANLLPQAKATWQTYHDSIDDEDHKVAVKGYIEALGI